MEYLTAVFRPAPDADAAAAMPVYAADAAVGRGRSGKTRIAVRYGTPTDNLKIETEAPQGTFRRLRVFVRCPFRTPHNSLSRLPPVFPHLSLPASAFSHRPTPLLFLSPRFLPCFRPCYARNDVQNVKNHKKKR